MGSLSSPPPPPAAAPGFFSLLCGKSRSAELQSWKADDPCFTSLLKVKVKQPSIANRGSAPFHGRSPHATTEESEPSHQERLQSKKRVFKSEINPASSFGIIRKAGLFLGFCRFSQVSVMATPSSLFVSERRCCLLPPNIS